MGNGGCWLTVVNWDTYQHYRDRNPPWIKFHSSALEDPVIAALPDAAKAHLFGVWLLASRLDNKIPADPAFIGKRINATTKIDLSLLLRCGFVDWGCGCEQHASNPLATCSERNLARTQRRDRGETEERQSRAETETEQRAAALVALFNAIIQPRRPITLTPGNRFAADRCFGAGYTMEQAKTAFEAVRDKSTPTASWCANNKREFEFLVRPTYKHRETKEPIQGTIDKILNELALGKRAS